jgi:hypothetical protein
MDGLALQIVEAGSPADKPGATVVDLHSLPNQVSGSIFGIKVNNQIKITVASQDFKPRVMIAHSAAAGLMSNPMMGASPVLTVGAENSEGLGTNTVVLTYDRSKPVPRGASTCIVVTSDDGKAVTGKYTLTYAK